MRTLHRFVLSSLALAIAVDAGCASDLDMAARAAAATSNPVIARRRPDGTMGYYRHGCADVAGAMRCALLRLTDAQGQNLAPATRPDGSPSGLHPDEVQAAYMIPTWGGPGTVVAIVDAFDNPNAEADLQVYRNQFGLPPCTTANGCFRKVNQNGNTSPLPSGDAGWGVEIALDLDAVSAACPSCKLLLVEASSATYGNLLAAERTAVNLGATILSNSWGGGEYVGETSDSISWSFPGVSTLFASGDDGVNSFGFPAASQYVTAVGGTRLTKDATSARGWRETAWTDGGSGCSLYIPKPSWQHDNACAKRTVADVAAVADPFTGLAVYDSYQESGWIIVGGTSLSSPLVAGIYATAGIGGAGPSMAYATDAFFDVTTGSTGPCTGILCNAAIGYDGPSGNGTPSGTLLVNPPDPARVVGGGITGDFDGDGKDDAMAFYDNGNASAALWVFPGTTGTTDGAIAPYRVWFAPGPNNFDANRAKVSAGDFDGDGKADVLVLYDYGNTSAALFVFPGVASHAQNATRPYRAWSVQGPNAFDVGRAKLSAGDFNADGKADLLALYDYGGSSAGLFVFPGTASHADGASQPYRIWFAPGPNAFDVWRTKVSAGDFDGDGKADLLALYDYGGSSAGLFVFPGTTSHTEGALQPYRIWSVPGPNAFDVWRTKVSAGDFNADGKADLLALYDYGNASAGLFVFPGVASHTEGASQPYRVWFAPGPNNFDVSRAKITAGDFDHNGKDDVMALYDYGSGSAGLFIFPGTTAHGDGSTTPYRVWNPGPGSFDLRLARVP